MKLSKHLQLLKFQILEKIKKYNVSFEHPPVLLGIKSYSDDVALQKEIVKKKSEYYNKPGSAGIINLTGDALYLTYIKDNNYFHKIYINWLNNLYPDYCEKLNKKIAKDIIKYLDDIENAFDEKEKGEEQHDIGRPDIS